MSFTIKEQIDRHADYITEALHRYLGAPNSNHASDLLNNVWAAIGSLRRASIEWERLQGDTPTELVERSGEPDRVEETHDAYGFISLSHITGVARLAGSMLDALPGFVELRIMRGIRRIDTHLHTENWSHLPQRPPLLTLRMSFTQWAELIMTAGKPGVPCTLASFNGTPFAPVPESAKTPLERISHDAQASAKDQSQQVRQAFEQQVKTLKDLIDSTTLPKRRKEEITRHLTKLENLSTVPARNAAWATQRIAEDVERLTSHARVEIAGAFEAIAKLTGASALAALPQATESTKEETNG